MDALIEKLCEAGRIGGHFNCNSVDARRRNVFAGGVAILAAVFSQLKIAQMRWSEGAMREGLLFDMIGRYTDEDARERTVQVDAAALSRRSGAGGACRADGTQTAVAGAGRAGSCRIRWPNWSWCGPAACTRSGWTWRTAATTATAPTCSRMRTCRASRVRSSVLLARLVGAHRRKLLLEGIEDLAAPWDDPQPVSHADPASCRRCCIGIAASTPIPEVTLVGRPRTLELRFRVRSFRDHPLTAADLNDEIDHLRAQGLRLRVFTS